MAYRVREATGHDYEALCALYTEADLQHHEALPAIFAAPSAPVRTRKFLGRGMAKPLE
jgi:hypothetical protein